MKCNMSAIKRAIAITSLLAAGTVSCIPIANAYDMSDYKDDARITRKYPEMVCSEIVDDLRSQSLNSSDAEIYLLAWKNEKLTGYIAKKTYDYVVDNTSVPVDAQKDLAAISYMITLLEIGVIKNEPRGSLVNVCTSVTNEAGFNAKAGLKMLNEVE